jgi:hypothetical protein
MRSRFYGYLLQIVIVLFGLWTLYTQIFILAGASYNTLRSFSFIPVLIAASIMWRAVKETQQAPKGSTPATAQPQPHTKPNHWLWLRIGGPFAISLLYLVTQLDWLVWVLALLYLSTELWVGRHHNIEPPTVESPSTRVELFILVGLCVLAVLLTSASLRPDADDAYFLSVAIATTSFPNSPLQSIDALHRSGLPPVEQALHLPQVYEILIGLIADISGLSVYSLYYVILPALFAILSILANWLLLRHFLPAQQAIWGIVIYVLLLIFWGDGHRTFGNFGFVRLFQGKAIYLMVILPFIALSALRYYNRPSLTSWLGLSLSQFAAIGITTNGMVVAPLAMGLCLLANLRFNRSSLWLVFSGFGSSLPVILVSGGLYLKMAPYLAAISVDERLLSYTTTLGIIRAPFVLLGLLLLPILATLAKVKYATWLKGFVWLVIFIIFMPATRNLGADILGNVFSWRLFWAVPIPFLLSLAGASAIRLIRPHRKFVIGLVTVWSLTFMVAGPTAISSQIFSLDNLGRPKVIEAPFTVAKKTIALAQSDTPALVPEDIAIYMTGFPNCPPLVGVRTLYLTKLQGFISNQALARRLALFQYISQNNPNLSANTALAEIEAWGITTVVFNQTHRDAPALKAAFTEQGFALYPIENFVIATQAK